MTILPILLSGRGRFITHVGSWLLVAGIMFYLLLSIRPPQEAAARTLLNLSFPILLFYLNSKVLVNRLFEKRRYREWGFWSIVLWIGMAALRSQMEIRVFGGTIFTNSEFSNDYGWRTFLVAVMLFFGLMLFSGLYQLLENRREMDALHTAAQINYLKAQINPHFLFNTLHNIYSAVTLQHPRAADMVLRLSDLLRYVTYDTQSEEVPLEKEIVHIKAYIDLFQLKTDTPLPIRFQTEGNLAGQTMEPMLMLPLVENALKHGDLDLNPNGYLHILLRLDNKRLFLQVENTFDPENLQKDDIGGVGLTNIRKRLKLKYGPRHSFETEITNRVFTARLSVPSKTL